MQEGIVVAAFHHVAITVKDVKKSKPFYEGIFGLKPIYRPDLGFPGEWYQVGNQQLHLMQDQVPLNQRQHFALEVANIHLTFNTLKEYGVTIVSPPGKRAHDNSDFMFCLDPDENLVEITHHE
jgi:glyoxylase I family protein